MNTFQPQFEIPSLPSFMNDWFVEYIFSASIYFPKNVPSPVKKHVSILYEFEGPFKEHDPRELNKRDEGIKYPIIKQFEEKSEQLETPDAEDLRARSDFVFAASLNWFDNPTQIKIRS